MFQTRPDFRHGLLEFENNLEKEIFQTVQLNAHAQRIQDSLQTNKKKTNVKA